MWPILDPKAPTELGGFPEKNMQNLAKKLAPRPFPRRKGKMGWSQDTPLRGRKMGFSQTSITFCRCNQFWIVKVHCDRGKILYNIFENRPKIQLLVRFIGYQTKAVKRGGSSLGARTWDLKGLGGNWKRHPKGENDAAYGPLGQKGQEKWGWQFSFFLPVHYYIL